MTRTLLLIGSLGNDDGPGFIRVSDFDARNGSTQEIASVALQNPSYLALAPEGDRLFSVDEVVQGSLAGYSLDRASGALSFAGRAATRGDWPCHINFDRTGRYALVTNFGQWDAASEGAQQLAVIPIGTGGSPLPARATARHTGTLGPRRPKQDRPHAHCTVVSPDNRFVLATDFGYDCIFVYPFDAATGLLGPASACPLPPGSAPRTLALAPDGVTVYASLELSSEIAKLSFDPVRGALTLLGIASTLPAGAAVENFPAELRLACGGRFAYVGNRGHESIGIFALDGELPRLVTTQPTGGSWPRCIAVTPDDRSLVVANQMSGDVRLFAIDPNSGALSGGAEIARAPAPAFVGVVNV
jgi:6-phosphogluconolactonase